MTQEDAMKLKNGDRVYVSWGRKGRQLAVLVADPYHRAGALVVPVQKYRANSRSWTGRIGVFPREILGRVSAASEGPFPTTR